MKNVIKTVKFISTVIFKNACCSFFQVFISPKNSWRSSARWEKETQIHFKSFWSHNLPMLSTFLKVKDQQLRRFFGSSRFGLTFGQFLQRLAFQARVFFVAFLNIKMEHKNSFQSSASFVMYSRNIYCFFENNPF